MGAAARRADDPVAALADLEHRLHAGARVVDVRCDDGRALVALARAFPSSTFHGFSPDAVSVRSARRTAASAGVSDRVTFEVTAAGAVVARGFDLVIDGMHVAGLAAPHART